jgi:hypothetical protein
LIASLLRCGWRFQLNVQKMMLTVHIEIDERMPQSGTVASASARTDDLAQRDVPCHIAANFVAQLAATFLHCPQTRARRRIDLRDAVQVYNNATTPARVAAGTAICCTT